MFIDLPQEKQVIINAIRSGHNVCITGPAGTGKSFLLTKIKEFFPWVHITASTGVAAVNVSGITLHSWAGLGNGKNHLSEIIRFIRSGPGTKVKRRLKKASLIAIDEISMISATVLDLFDQVLQNIRENDLPFGGLQVIVIGDFCQLPPVEDQAQQICFSFESQVWQQANFKIFQLQQIYRQVNKRFIELLNNIRMSNPSADDLELLRSREIINFSDNLNLTILVTHNYQSDALNEVELAKLPNNQQMQFFMSETGDSKYVTLLKNNCLAKETITLKIGAKVMMLRNSLAKHGIINGSIGIVIDFSKQKYPIVKFADGKLHTITTEEWCIETYDEVTGNRKIEAAINQVPLALAWAITIHKSQGLTLDQVLCDLQKVFVPGQAYVALSRAKSLDGLFIKNFNAQLLKIDSKVQQFYAKLPILSF